MYKMEDQNLMIKKIQFTIIVVSKYLTMFSMFVTNNLNKRSTWINKFCAYNDQSPKFALQNFKLPYKKMY